MGLSSLKSSASSSSSLMMRIVLILSSFALMLIGFVMIYSASTITALAAGVSPLGNLIDQLVFAVIGIVLGLGVWKVLPTSLWRDVRILWIVWGIVFLLLIATALFGTEVNGARRWLLIAGRTIQPSEFAKVAFILMAVHAMDLYSLGELDTRRLIIYGIVGILLPVALLLFSQSDLGTTAICLMGVLSVLWLGGMPLSSIVRLVLLLLAGVVLLIVFGAGYRSDRFLFVNPWADGQDGRGAGYQIAHSYYAITNGGLLGVGLGNSSEKFLYLPEAETDYIFAIICEELGMLGALAVIVLFLLVLFAGLRIALQAPDAFGSMMAGSFAIILVTQAFLNIGCVIGVLPTTGKPLPFVSSGGSSLVTSLIMIGFILSVSRDADAPSVYERRRANLTIIRNHANEPRGSRGALMQAGYGSDEPLGFADGRRSGKRPAAAGSVAYAGGRYTAMSGMAYAGGFNEEAGPMRSSRREGAFSRQRGFYPADGGSYRQRGRR